MTDEAAGQRGPMTPGEVIDVIGTNLRPQDMRAVLGAERVFMIFLTPIPGRVGHTNPALRQIVVASAGEFSSFEIRGLLEEAIDHFKNPAIRDEQVRAYILREE